MQKKTFMKKIICGAVIGTMALSMTAAGFADDTKTEDAKAEGKQLRLEMKGELGFRAKGGVGILEKLVEAGVVSQEKADAMKTYMEAQVQERKEEFEKLKDLSQEERKAYFEAHKEEKVNFYDQMVKDGILSEEDGAKIKTYLEENKALGLRGKMDGNGLETILDKLVKEGKLKEDSSKAIQEYMKTWAEERKAEIEKLKEERKAEMEKIKNLTAEEKKAYFENNKKERVDILEKMVENGVITADEAKIIKEAMPQRKTLQRDTSAI